MTVYQRRAAQIGLSIALLGAIPATKAGADQHGPTKRPFEILESAHRFGAQAGRGWNLTREATAFAAVFATDDAREEFASLIENANPPARLYGLCGLYRLQAPGFNDAVVRVSASQERVDTIRGCFAERRPLSEILVGTAEGKRSSEFIQICRTFPPFV